MSDVGGNSCQGLSDKGESLDDLHFNMPSLIGHLLPHRKDH
jgi:hypothetical protein